MLLNRLLTTQSKQTTDASCFVTATEPSHSDTKHRKSVYLQHYQETRGITDRSMASNQSGEEQVGDSVLRALIGKQPASNFDDKAILPEAYSCRYRGHLNGNPTSTNSVERSSAQLLWMNEIAIETATGFHNTCECGAAQLANLSHNYGYKNYNCRYSNLISGMALFDLTDIQEEWLRQLARSLILPDWHPDLSTVLVTESSCISCNQFKRKTYLAPTLERMRETVKIPTSDEVRFHDGSKPRSLRLADLAQHAMEVLYMTSVSASNLKMGHPDKPGGGRMTVNMSVIPGLTQLWCERQWVTPFPSPEGVHGQRLQSLRSEASIIRPGWRGQLDAYIPGGDLVNRYVAGYSGDDSVIEDLRRAEEEEGLFFLDSRGYLMYSPACQFPISVETTCPGMEVKRKRARRCKGHTWIYVNEAEIGDTEAFEMIREIDFDENRLSRLQHNVLRSRPEFWNFYQINFCKRDTGNLHGTDNTECLYPTYTHLVLTKGLMQDGLYDIHHMLSFLETRCWSETHLPRGRRLMVRVDHKDSGARRFSAATLTASAEVICTMPILRRVPWQPHQLELRMAQRTFRRCSEIEDFSYDQVLYTVSAHRRGSIILVQNPYDTISRYHKQEYRDQ